MPNVLFYHEDAECLSVLATGKAPALVAGIRIDMI